MYGIYKETSAKNFGDSNLRKAYKDIDLSMGKNPVTNDIMTVSGINSIKQSLQVLVLLNHYEKPFHEEMGSDIYKSVFDNYEKALTKIMESRIRGLVSKHEPRVEIQEIIVAENRPNNNLHIRIEFKVIETLELADINFFLQIDR